jgi:uncharacterized repeat protein (TIGR03803 family)
MRTPFFKLHGLRFLQAALLIGSAWLRESNAASQTLTVLYNFSQLDTSRVPNINSDGAYPRAGVIMSDNTLYGTTSYAGTGGYGTVFSVSTDGSGFTVLHDCGPSLSDADKPFAPLLLLGNTLYGTTFAGGENPATGNGGYGAVFSINTDGSGFTVLHGFDEANIGDRPYGGLVLSGDTLYGTASQDDSASYTGTVFRLSTNGTSYAVLHTFAGVNQTTGQNGGGAFPYAGLVLFGDTLYGVASQGGSGGNGTVFRIKTNGTAFAVLHNFTAYGAGSYTNSDGAMPMAPLVRSGDTLYGTTSRGGPGNGTIFAVKTNGTGFLVLHTFNGGYPPPPSALVLSGNTLYGVNGNNMYSIKTDGTAFTNLYAFSGTDGRGPEGLILFDNTLYGTANGGGEFGPGTVFSLALPQSPPQLTITPARTNVVLTWPTVPADFTLQSTTDLTSPGTWAPVSSLPILVDGQNTVTNLISVTQQFYRLKQ